MANNAFFEFLKDANKELKGLYDDSNYYGAWANQYNPYGGRGVSNWFRGLGAIHHMIDRNAANRARKAQQQAYKANTEDTPPTNVGIGVDANGFHGMEDMNSILSAKPEVSISAGSYGNGDVTPQANKFSFNESDYIPSAENGYHLGDYPQTEMYGDPADFQRQMASNAIGYDLGSLEPRQQKWFTPSSGGNGFSSIFNGNSFKGGSLVNPPTPSTSSNSNSLAQGIEGQNNASARDLSRYLSDDYNIANWMQADVGRGVDNPYISALRYSIKIAPLVQAAKEDRLKNLFMASSNPDLSDEERKQARIQLAGELNKPDLLSDLDYTNWQRQKAKEEFEHNKSMWNVDDLAKRLRVESAQESINDKREGRKLKLNAQKLQTLFGDGKIYNIPLNETMEDTGLKNTNPEVVTGLNLLNTYARKLFNTDLGVNGGWRSEEHQRRLYKEQGKEPFMGSLHLKGRAADIDVSRLSDAQRNELVDFAEQLGFHTTYHDIGNGIHLHVELGDGRHIADVNSLLAKNGITTGKNKNNSNAKETGSKYDSQTLADMMNQTYTEGKKHGTDEERAKIGNYMSGIVGRFIDPAKDPTSSYGDTAEKVYNYYHNTVGASKGWTLNSEEFTHLVSRAVHKYYSDNFGVDIPLRMIEEPLFRKFDPESKEKQQEVEKWKEENKNAPKSPEEQAKKVLGVTKDGRVEHVDATPKKAGSKTSQNLDQPITFGGIMDKLRVGNDKNRNENMTWKWK